MTTSNIPESLTLTVEDIRHLRNIQLAILTGIDASNFSAWSKHRKISERSLDFIAERIHMKKVDLLQGIELRRRDTAIARTAQDKADRLIAHLGLAKESA